MPTRPRILVVDDESDVILLFRTWLESAGYEVFESGNGADALQQIHEKTFHLVLMDYAMPYLNANQVSEALEKVGKASTPLLFITGHTDLETETLKEEGARDVLYKPVDQRMLLYRVAKLLNSHPKPA